MNGNFISDLLGKTDGTDSGIDKTSVKNEDIDYTCSVCEDEFASEVLLFDHYSFAHSDEVDNFCKICHLRCSSESILKIHNAVLHSDQRIPHREGLSPQQSCERVQSSPSDERSRDRTPYACGVCEALFFHENLLTEHVKEHTKDKTYELPRCGENIPETSDVKIRLSKKLRSEMKLTSESTFRSNASFKEQHGQCAGSPSYSDLQAGTNTDEVSDTSEYTFRSNASFKVQHSHCAGSPSSSNSPAGTNTDELSDTYDCNACKTHFLSEDLLVQHVNDLPCTTHHSRSSPEPRCRSSPDPPVTSDADKASDPRSYVCDVCEARFFSEDLLARHVTEHANDDAQAETTPDVRRRELKGRKRFKCNFCDKQLSSKYLVKEHMRVHTGEKPFECETCGRKFSHKPALREHTLLYHDGDEPVADARPARYKCPQCDEKFPAMTRLKTHLRARHGAKSSFACSSCDSVFTSASQLKVHYNGCAPEELFSCGTCKALFRNERLLRRHLAKHRAERRFECGVCGKKFAYEYLLREHLPKHTGEKPFECEKCGRHFPYKSSLRVHRKQAHGDSAADNTPVEEDSVEG